MFPVPCRRRRRRRRRSVPTVLRPRIGISNNSLARPFVYSTITIIDRYRVDNTRGYNNRFVEIPKEIPPWYQSRLLKYPSGITQFCNNRLCPRHRTDLKAKKEFVFVRRKLFLFIFPDRIDRSIDRSSFARERERERKLVYLADENFRNSAICSKHISNTAKSAGTRGYNWQQRGGDTRGRQISCTHLTKHLLV